MNTFFISTLTVLLFFGGWSWPSFGALLDSTFGDSAPAWAANVLGTAWFMVKVYVVAAVIFWFRGTYPRLRIDQLMAFGWQVLIPLSFANLVLVAVVMFYGWPTWTMALISVPFLAGVVWFASRRYADPRKVTTVRIYRRTTRADGEPALVPQENS
jgi:NADH-quinone oxidoreductase subunit H